MKCLLADSSFWIALLNAKDPQHEGAQVCAAGLGKCKLVATRWIIMEVLNYFSDFGPNLRRQAFLWASELEDEHMYEIQETDAASWKNALELYSARPDKSFSLTDCISFVVMRNLGITEALTHDCHFEQEGFTALLRKATAH